MAKSETLSTAAKPEDLDKAYASAVKALSVLGIKMTTKKPDPAKIGPAMKGNKKALFKLGGDMKALKMTVECDGTLNTLGIFDLAAEKDLQRRIVLLKSLTQSGLIDGAKEIKALESQLKGGIDPKVIANIERETAAAQKTIADAKKALAAVESLRGWEAAKKVAPFMKEVEAYAKKTHAEENILFLKALAANLSRDKLMALFIVDGAKYQVDVDGALRAQMISGAKDPSDGAAWIQKDVQQNLLSKVIEGKQKEFAATIAAATKRIAELAAMKKKLSAA